MKKILFILACVIVWMNVFSQTYPVVPRANQSFTVQDARFSAQYNLFAPRYNDTTAANLQLGNDSLSAVIFCYNTMTLWVRSHNGSVKYWLEVGSGSGGFANPMTTEGDLIIGGVSGVAGRLAIGANTFILTSDGTTFSWQPPGSGSGTVTSAAMTVPSFLSVSGSPITNSGTFTVTLSGTALPAINGGTGQTVYAVGDLLTANTITTLSKIAASTIGYVLTANGIGVVPTWQAIPSYNLAVKNPPGAAGDSIWYTSGDTLYIRTFNGATIEADGSVTIAGGGGMTNPMTTAGDIIVGGSSGTPARLGIGTALQILRVNAGATALEWAAAAGGGDVSKVGTPVNNQLGVWTGNGTIEGDANLTFASSTLSIGVAGAATGIFTQSGVTSGTVTFQPASVAGTYTLTWPTGDGDANQVLTSNGSGVLSWTTPSAGGGSPALTVLTSGTTWTTPSDITASTVFKITLVGGGGGGAGHNTTNGEGSGGGAGGALVVYITGLTASNGYTYAIGAAGAAGDGTPSAGGAGGNTTLTIGATTYTGNGGNGGATAQGAAGGVGGTATNGDINIKGQDGAGTGGTASTATGGVPGGSPGFGIGVGGGAVRNSAGSGLPGTGFGAGGGGGTGGAAPGGAGTQGAIIIERIN